MGFLNKAVVCQSNMPAVLAEIVLFIPVNERNSPVVPSHFGPPYIGIPPYSDRLMGPGGGRGGTHLLLLALVISPSTTHPFRDGAPFLLLIETPPTFGRSLRFFHRLHTTLLRGGGGLQPLDHRGDRYGLYYCPERA